MAGFQKLRFCVLLGMVVGSVDIFSRCSCDVEFPISGVNLGCHGACKDVPSKLAKMGDTLPETNIAPKNRPLEKEIPIGNHHF